MAKENVKKFFDEVSKKEELQKQLASASEKSNAEMANIVKAHAEAVVAIAKACGFDFSVDELLASGEGDKKLDVNELDAVAGGGYCVVVGGNKACLFAGTGKGYGCFLIGFD